MNDSVELTHDSKKGSITYTLDGLRKAEMTFVFAGEGQFIIDHTEVDSSLKGQGIGNRLLEKAVEFARETNAKIIPLCPFAASVFRKNPDISDVLKK
jgi:predicted GNAT family acetyltransferase